MNQLEIKGEGYIREIERGKKYAIRFSYRDPLTREWKKAPQRTIRGNKAKARAILESYKVEFAQKFNNPGLLLTLSEYIDFWSKGRPNTVSPQTINREQIEIRAIKKLLGDITITDLSVADIKKALVLLNEEGRSRNAIHKFQIKLNQILDCAEAENIIAANPCRKLKDKVSCPTSSTRKSLSVDQAIRLAIDLKEAPRNGSIVAVWLALALGLRRGEALGLQWQDVNFENSTICIQRQLNAQGELAEPKCASQRTLSFDAGTHKFLEEWEILQAQQYYDAGRHQEKNTPVCSASVLVRDGRPIDYIEPSNFDRWRRRFFAAHGLGHFSKIEPNAGKRRISIQDTRDTTCTSCATPRPLSLSGAEQI